MKPFLSLTSLLLMASLLSAQEVPAEAGVIYLFPGQGADHRQFTGLHFPEGYEIRVFNYPVPERRERMESYARRFLPHLDTGKALVLVGVSLGGMICTELADLVDARQVILISSAKGGHELPGRYSMQQKLPLNRLVPAGLTKAGALLLQGIVEPDRSYDPALFRSMLRGKDPLYLKRTVDMIVNWDRQEHDPGIIHIHGDADHTLPIDHISCDHVVEGGSHMMVVTRAEEISLLLEKSIPHWTVAH